MSDYDVVIVGGGPAGCSAGVFTARYGLDAVIFDRGNSSLRRCAYLENYLGFPGGIDVDTFYELLHDHAESAGCELVADLVESVNRGDDGDFVVETQECRSITADRVVAATRYDGSYLRPLGDDGMFLDHDGTERFDRDYPDGDGRTPNDGLYVASPCGERDVQAIVAAGQGAHVARSLLEDYRQELGFPEPVARHYDWLRPEAEGESSSGNDRDIRERRKELFDERVPEDYEPSGEQLDALRKRYVDRVMETYVAADEFDRRCEQGHRRLVGHLDQTALVKAADVGAVLDGVDDEMLLDAVDDDRIRERALELREPDDD